MRFRDPRKVLQGRVAAKVNRAGFDAEQKAKQKIRGAGKAAKGGAKGKKTPKQPKKKKMGFWPFGGSGEGGAAVEACGSCGKEADPNWAVCPYCQSPLGEAPGPAGPIPLAPGAAPEMPVVQGQKTVAIDLDALKPKKRRVVGWLVALDGSQEGQDFRLFEGRNAIGAAADSDVVLTDEYLSAAHATIRFEDGKYELIDHDSTNGSFANEKRVTREELIDNDTIRLGRTTLRFKALY